MLSGKYDVKLTKISQIAHKYHKKSTRYRIIPIKKCGAHMDSAPNNITLSIQIAISYFSYPFLLYSLHDLLAISNIDP